MIMSGSSANKVRPTVTDCPARKHQNIEAGGKSGNDNSIIIFIILSVVADGLLVVADSFLH